MLERQQWLLALGVAKQQGGGLDADSAGLRSSVMDFRMMFFCVCLGGDKAAFHSSWTNSIKNVRNNRQLLISHIMSIRDMTSDPDNIDPMVN